MKKDKSPLPLTSYVDTAHFISPGFSTKNKAHYKIFIDEQPAHDDDNPKVLVCLANWSTAALFGLAMCIASPVIIGAVGHKLWQVSPPLHPVWGLTRRELFDLIYLTTDIWPGHTYAFPPEVWIHTVLQPVSIPSLYNMVQRDLFNPATWTNAAKWYQSRCSSSERSPQPKFSGNTEGIQDPRGAEHDTGIHLELYLGEWDTNSIFGLAMAIAGQIILGAVTHRCWNAETFQHATWELEWEELAAVIFLITGYRTDRKYSMTLEHLMDRVTQPLNLLPFYNAVHGDIYDPATWIATAHMILDKGE